MGMKVTVNGKEVVMAGEEKILASYVGVVRLSGLPERKDYTVTWRDTEGDNGTLASHENIWISPGMIFNITLTGAT